jgi:hypothetical protein
VGPFVLLLFIGVPQILAAFILVRGLRRWARGVVDKKGERRFPGIGRTILAAIGMIILGVVALEVTVRVLPASDRPSPFLEAELEMEEEMIGHARMMSDQMESSGQIEWFRGEPEAILPVEIHPGLNASFRLVCYDGREDRKGTLKYARIGSWESIRSSGPPMRSLVKVGTTGEQGEDRDSERGFTALLEFTGDTATLPWEDDFTGWTFDFPRDQELIISKEGEFRYPLATCIEHTLTEDKQVGRLELEVIVTEQ